MLCSRNALIAVLGWLACPPVLAAECSQPDAPPVLSNDDQICIDKLKKQFSAHSLSSELPDIPFRSERNKLLIQHFEANQRFVIDTFYFNYCELLNIDRWGLAESDKTIKLKTASDELYAHVPFGSLEVDTRNVAFLLPAREKQMLASSTALRLTPLAASLLTGFLQVPTEDGADVADTRPQYLRDVPFVVTKANKHFVMVASVSSLDAARSEALRLKRKAPQFDFVVYSPYAGNPNYAIMMAAWVPYSVAKLALADAMQYVSRGSMIWSCRSEGDRC